MKKKLLTFLLSVFMIIPIVGCGEKDLGQDPSDSEAKIVVKFAHYDETTQTSSRNNVPYSYSDCATVSGEGFYKLGETATLSIEVNPACGFRGWGIADKSSSTGEIINRKNDPTWNYTIREADIGHTVEIFAQMYLGRTESPFGDTATKFHLKSISTTKYSFNTEYPITKDGDDYKFTIDSIVYTKGEDDLGNESYNGSDGSKNKILANNKIVIGDEIYTIVEELDVPVKIGVGGDSETTTNLDPTNDYSKYKFAGSMSSFQTFADLLAEKSSDPGVTLYEHVNGNVDRASNLSYYYLQDQLQFYKITWKYATGTCSTSVVPDQVFDPVTKTFENANVCISANIDLTQGITQDFVKDAIKSTLYNRAYVATSDDHDCLVTTKGDVSIDPTCMYIKNIGVLTNVEKDASISLEDGNLAYYALTTDSLGMTRIESFDQQFGNKYYTSMTYKDDTFTGTKDLYKVVYDSARLDDYNAKITPLYDELVDILANPGTIGDDISFGYSANTESIVVKSLTVGTTTYYFNYIAAVEDGGDYKPSSSDGSPVHTTMGIIGDTTTHYAFNMEISNTDPDKTALTLLKTKLAENPQNFFEVNNTTAAVSNIIKELIRLNTDLSSLKKYDFNVSLNTGTISVTYEDGTIDLSSFAGFKYAYDASNNIYYIPYDNLDNPTSLGTSTNTTINQLYSMVNILSSADSIVTNEDYYIEIDANSTSGYVEYRFYNATTRTQLEYRLRYYESETAPKLQIVNINYDRVELELTFIKPGDTTLFTNGSFTSVAGEGKTISTPTTYSNLVKNTLYKFTVDTTDYYIDIERSKVFTNLTPGNGDIYLNSNIGTEFKYYFVIGETYYGLYETSFNSGEYNLYKLVVNSFTNITKGELVDSSTITAIFIQSRQAYFVVESETVGEGEGAVTSEYITINDEKATLTTVEGKYQVTITKIVATNSSGNLIDYEETDDVYMLYQLLNDDDTDIRHVSTASTLNRIMFVSENVLYELTSVSEGVYSITYNTKVYQVTFTATAS